VPRLHPHACPRVGTCARAKCVDCRGGVEHGGRRRRRGGGFGGGCDGGRRALGGTQGTRRRAVRGARGLGAPARRPARSAPRPPPPPHPPPAHPAPHTSPPRSRHLRAGHKAPQDDTRRHKTMQDDTRRYKTTQDAGYEEPGSAGHTTPRGRRAICGAHTAPPLTHASRPSLLHRPSTVAAPHSTSPAADAALVQACHHAETPGDDGCRR
jgi:hypothetical protein